MRRSPRWIDGRFANVHETFPGLRSAEIPWREFFCAREERRPKAPLPVVGPSALWSEPTRTGLRVTWLGHSTLFVEIGAFRILTDPIWGSRASPAPGLGPRRFQPPPVPLGALPPIDLVLLSHDHYDHLDYGTIRALAPCGVPFVAPLGVGAHLERWGIEPHRITELDWWEQTQAGHGRGRLIVTSTPAQHFSGRGLGTRNHTLWSSYVLECGDRRLFYGGDSGLMPGFTEIRDRLGPVDLSAIEIGAYHPAWGDIHMGPVNALAALEMLGGGPLVPIHWGTFDLATHRWDQPIEVLTQRAAESGAELMVPRLGEPVEPDILTEVTAWWRPVAALHGEGQGDGDAARDTVAVGRHREGEPTHEGREEPID
jgi:L-ascorbate metabolism protein UlaG (beta-lactamase superfamily)